MINLNFSKRRLWRQRLNLCPLNQWSSSIIIFVHWINEVHPWLSLSIESMKFIHNYLCTLNQCSSSIIIFVHWFNVAKWDFLKVSNTVYTWNWRRFSCIFSTLLSDLKEKPESNPLQLGNAYQLEFSERNEENEIALVEMIITWYSSSKLLHLTF